jgi:hypothetical protein
MNVILDNVIRFRLFMINMIMADNFIVMGFFVFVGVVGEVLELLISCGGFLIHFYWFWHFFVG